MTLKEAEKRIKYLEDEIARLKAQPKQEIHYHYPYYYTTPQWPTYPSYPWYPVTVGETGLVGTGTQSACSMANTSTAYATYGKHQDR